jgi:hypothetical protein
MMLATSPEAVVVLAAAAGTLLGALRTAAAARVGLVPLRGPRRAAARMHPASGGRAPLRLV